MAANGNEFRTVIAPGPDLGRARSTADPAIAQDPRRAVIDRSAVAPRPLLPRAAAAACRARHLRVERGTV
jgi:hypothetical protein